MTHVLTHRGLPGGMSRWDLYGLLVKAAKHFGLTDTMLKYLRFAIARTQDQDYAAGRICALWPSVSETASQLEADPRQIARAEARLAELGFIVKSSAARCRRYGVRSENVIRYAFGINLAPLVDRAREIEAAARKVCFEKEEAKRLRLHIPKLLERVRTSGDASAEEAAEVILPSRRPSRIWRYARLKEIADALEALIETLADAPEAVEMSDRCDADVAPREGRKTNSKRSSSGQTEPRLSPAQFCILASPGFEDAVRQYATPGVPPDWRTIPAAAKDWAQVRGIPAGLWQRQVDCLGPEKAAICLLVADRNAERNGSAHQVDDMRRAFLGLARNTAARGSALHGLIGELQGLRRQLHDRATMPDASGQAPRSGGEIASHTAGEPPLRSRQRRLTEATEQVFCEMAKEAE